MDELSREMDRHAAMYAPDDGQSWWAKTAGGEQRLVRHAGRSSGHSDIAAELLVGERWLRIGALPGDGHVPEDPTATREALFKPVGVVAGISDVPWHKDCSLGRHTTSAAG